MKILSLEILSPNREHINDVTFNEVGVSIIYGDVENPEESGKTSNSLGKTILLSFIDFIYGKEFQAGQKPNYNTTLKDYIIKAKILLEDNQHTVSRIIGDNINCFIDDKEYNLGKYLDMLKLKRKYIDKQFFLAAKNDDIFSRQYPSQSDYISLLDLLNLDGVIAEINEVYNLQDDIKEIKKVRKTKYGDSITIDEITEELYFISENLKTKEKEIERVKELVSNIDTTSLKEEIIVDYNNLNTKIKNIYNKIAKVDLELERLEVFIDSFDNNDITSEQIINLFEQAQFETPELVKKRLEEVEKFNKSVMLDRTKNIIKQKEVLKAEKNFLNTQITEIQPKIDELGKIISENEVYIEQLEIYSKYNDELNELKYRQGQLSDIEEYAQKIEKYKTELTQAFIKAKEDLNKYTNTVDNYRSFINDIVKNIYDNRHIAFFDIRIKDFDMRTRPVSIELNFQGDAGEGLGNVKKLLIDYLVFDVNDKLPIIVQDSSCYNGIDPRQKINLLEILDRIAIKNNKQAIISINKYEFFEDDLNWIENKSVLKLSEEETLFRFNF